MTSIWNVACFLGNLSHLRMDQALIGSYKFSVFTSSSLRPWKSDKNHKQANAFPYASRSEKCSLPRGLAWAKHEQRDSIHGPRSILLSSGPPNLFKPFITCINLCARAHIVMWPHTCHSAFVHPRTTCRGQLSPSTVWVLGIELILLGLVANTFACWASHLAGPAVAIL